MSHRKFSAPRHGHLGFLPRKRCKRGQPRVKAFRADNDKSLKPHLTAFMGYKAGMTHVLRDAQKVAQKVIDIEVVEPVTIIETPPMVVIGVKGYKKTPWGPKALTTVFTSKISESAKRRIGASEWNSPLGRLAFRHHEGLFDTEEYKKDRDAKIALIKSDADVVRIIAHTQPETVRVQKKAHIMEIQVNGGNIPAKVAFATNLLGKTIPFSDIFSDNDMIDVVGITKGKGTKGVVSRWGVTRLPRKTHKGLRKVACIGAWHPARVSFTVARVGAKGFHHRTEYNKKIYMVGKALDDTKNEARGKFAGTTDQDLTKKGINPLGGFPGYGEVTQDFVIVRGSVPGPRKRAVGIRTSIYPQSNRRAQESIKIKFIDTASKMGRGRFQTKQEKRAFLGKTKKEAEREREEKLRAARDKRKREEAQ